MDDRSLPPASDPYRMVLTAIERMEGFGVPVPRLAQLLGVKGSTLNARFRRQRTEVRTVGRTNYISIAVARELAQVHQHALAGWLTLQEASKLTGVKAPTLKAKCEKGQLTHSIDLTKRIRVDPGEFEKMQPNRCEAPVPKPLSRQQEERTKTIRQFPCIGRHNVQRPSTRQERPSRAAATARIPSIAGVPQVTLPMPPAPSSPPAPAVPFSGIRIVGPKDYGLPELAPTPAAAPPKPIASAREPKGPECLHYYPEKPFSVSLCRVGQRVLYERYEGTILTILDDPYSPRIKVHFPDHPHPLMQEVMLSVGRRTH